jgi:hypothetical protein
VADGEPLHMPRKVGVATQPWSIWLSRTGLSAALQVRMGYWHPCRAQEFDPYGCGPCRWTSWARQVRLARTPSLFIQSDSDEVLGPHNCGSQNVTTLSESRTIS